MEDMNRTCQADKKLCKDATFNPFVTTHDYSRVYITVEALPEVKDRPMFLVPTSAQWGESGNKIGGGEVGGIG
jgi:hypothetical protein